VVYSNGGEDTTTKEIIWSLFYDTEIDKRKLEKRTHFSSSFEPPEPEEVKLLGLKSIIETETINHEWRVRLNPGVHMTEERYIANPQITRPLPKESLEQAVRVADDFLQQAGVGMEIGHQETDDKDEDPF